MKNFLSYISTAVLIFFAIVYTLGEMAGAWIGDNLGMFLFVVGFILALAAVIGIPFIIEDIQLRRRIKNGDMDDDSCWVQERIEKIEEEEEKLFLFLEEEEDEDSATYEDELPAQQPGANAKVSPFEDEAPVVPPAAPSKTYSQDKVRTVKSSPRTIDIKHPSSY